MTTERCDARFPLTCRYHSSLLLRELVDLPQTSFSQALKTSPTKVKEFGEAYVDAYLESQQVEQIKHLIQVDVESVAKKMKPLKQFSDYVTALRKATDLELVDHFEDAELELIKDESSTTGWKKYVLSCLTISIKVDIMPTSTYGLENGRIFKFSVYNDPGRYKKMDFFKACLLHYDRSWSPGYAATSRLGKYIVSRVVRDNA